MINQKDDEPEVELTSPACAMHEADDGYMGYAGKDELIGFLNELLEAERAGARVASESARNADSDRIAELFRTIQRDEARWCGMLLGRIEALGEVPSRQVGAFYSKAMAISDVTERIRFLNRGQGWVVRKQRQMLPRVRNDWLHADLSAMLRAHEANITLANDAVTDIPSGSGKAPRNPTV
jgi:hypothetical protein